MVVEVMLHGDVDQQADVDVGDSIEHLAPLLAGFDQAGEPELAELVAGRRLGGANYLSELAYA